MPTRKRPATTARKPAPGPREPATRRAATRKTSTRKTSTRAPATVSPGPPLLPVPAVGRHRDILDAAAELMAERGYGGASLRELARRVGMSQPSLYHYFRTKEELALQLLETLAADMLGQAPTVIPDDPTQFPRLLADLVRKLYDTRQHPLYTRAVFAFSRMDPRFGLRNREIFVDHMLGQLRLGLAPFVARGELPEDECVNLLRMLVHAIGFRFMEERVLFDDRPLGPDVDGYVDYVVALCEQRIRALRRPPAA